MEAKGTAVQVVPNFIKDKFPAKYDEWLDSLPPGSQEIHRKPIISSVWYPIKEGLIIPTRKMCDMFYAGKIRGSTECGIFSANTSLTGIYKIFIKMGSPQFLMSKASTIFSTYYKPCEMKITDPNPDHAALQVTVFPESDEFLEEQIRSYIQRALELSGCKDVKVLITKSLAKGDSLTEFSGTWK